MKVKFLTRKGPWRCAKCWKWQHKNKAPMDGNDVCNKCRGSR